MNSNRGTGGDVKGPLSERMISGAVWLFVSFGLSKISRIGMMLVFAALLSPADYGLIGLSVVIVTTAQIINGFGIWQAVVFRKDPEARFVDTAFIANVVGGLLMTVVFVSVAPLIGRGYGEPEMTSLLWVMGLSLLPDALHYVPEGLLQKHLMFKRRALPEIVSALGAMLITIGLLLLGVGIFSYAIGFVAESVIRCVIVLKIVEWRPKLQVSRSYLKEIVSYGRHILGSELAWHISSNVDYIIVGYVLGAGPLGFYSLAFNLANYPVSNFAFVLKNLTFPTFAALREDLEYAKRVYLKLIQTLAALVMPTLVMLAILAPPLVVGLLGEKWQPSILPLQILIVSAVSRAVSFSGSDMLRALGYQRVPFRIHMLEGLAITVVLLLVVSRGIETVALAVMVILSVSSWAITVSACLAFGIGPREIGRAFVPGVVLTVSGAGVAFSLKLLGSGQLPEVMEVGLLSGAAGLAMAVCLMTVCKGFSRDIIALIRKTAGES